MQMEDDIFTMPGYLDVIMEFIAEQKSDWTCLEFSELGFIGKVYHSKYLERLAQIVLLFYEEQPVDYTFLYFNILNLQTQRITRSRRFVLTAIFFCLHYHCKYGLNSPMADKMPLELLLLE
jgi:alpha-1,3-mannosylglycoprotein beta-1,4-N-acetylglucosaminyltransferase C